MLYGLLNLCFHFSVLLGLMYLLLAGILLLAAASLRISLHFATFANTAQDAAKKYAMIQAWKDRALYSLIALGAAGGCFVIAGLLRAIGGGINAV